MIGLRDSTRTSDRIRVLIIEPAGLLWGSERALLDLLGAIDRDRFDVTVACPQDGPLQSRLDELDIDTASLPIATLHTRGKVVRLNAMLAIGLLLLRMRPQVIHLNQAGITRISAIPARMLGIPLVTHVRIDEDADLLQHRLPRNLAPRVAIAVSNSVARGLEGCPCEVRVVYDAYSRRQPQRSRAEVRNSLGIALDTPVICIAARLSDGKRHDLLIRALQILPNPATHLLIVGGDGEDSSGRAYGTSVRALVRDLNLQERVTFTGMRDDVLDFLVASDIVALPSDRETFGRVLLESLSVGTPIVGVDQGGPREIIGENERGYLFTRGDVSSLAESISKALANRAESAHRTVAGSAWVAERCAPEIHAERIQQIYTDVLV